MKLTARGQHRDENLCFSMILRVSALTRRDESFSNERSEAAKDPPLSDGFEKTINNNCYEGRGEGTTRTGQVRTIDLESQRGNVFDNNTIKEKTVRIWKFDGWKTDLNPARLTSFWPDSGRDYVWQWHDLLSRTLWGIHNIVTLSVDVVSWFILTPGQALAAPALLELHPSNVTTEPVPPSLPSTAL